jgi:antitoxin FitA
MVSLLIRDVDPALHARLMERAAAHHRSLEDEVRTLLRTGLAREDLTPRPENLVALAARLFGSDNGAELDIPARNRVADRPPPDFAADP